MSNWFFFPFLHHLPKSQSSALNLKFQPWSSNLRLEFSSNPRYPQIYAQSYGANLDAGAANDGVTTKNGGVTNYGEAGNEEVPRHEGGVTNDGVTSNERTASNDEAAINEGVKTIDGGKSDFGVSRENRLTVDDAVANKSRKVLFLFLVADARLYTLPCRSVGRSVGPSVRHIFEFQMVFALLLLPNCPRLDCRVSGLVFLH